MAKEKDYKTNVMRILDKANIAYIPHFYAHGDGAIDGMSVAEKLGQSKDEVFKTLVAEGKSKNHYVFVIPVAKELNLKAAAAAVGEKSVEMIPVKDINKITGYIRGGCSPIGMKKQFRTVIDSSAQALPHIMVSGGKIGTQAELSPIDLADVIDAVFEPITMEAHTL